MDAEQLFTEYFDPVYQFIHSRVGHRQEAEDLTSEVFEKIAKNLHTYRTKSGATIRSWIFTIARNTIVDFYRKKKYVTFDVTEIEIPVDTFLEQEVDDRKQIGELFKRIHALPETQCEIMLLRFTADLGNKEIARILNVPVSTVSSTISKTLAMLREVPQLS